MSVAWINRPIIWVRFVVKMRRNRIPCNACYLRFVRALICKPKLLTVALTVVRISLDHILNICRRPTLAVRAVTQSVHSAVRIFIFCVLISKDGPNRFQGSVIDGVMYILRTAIKERRCEPVLRGFALLLHWYENSLHKYTFVDILCLALCFDAAVLKAEFEISTRCPGISPWCWKWRVKLRNYWEIELELNEGFGLLNHHFEAW